MCRMKILITNTVALNGGDAAILYAVMELLKEAFGTDTEFIIYDSKPHIASHYHPTCNFRPLLYLNVKAGSRFKRSYRLLRQLNLWRMNIAAKSARRQLPLLASVLLRREEQRDLTHYLSADLIVSTGGTYLTENYSLEPRIFDYQISLILRRPLVFFTQSIGAFRDENNRRAFRQIFDQSLLILLRDELSYEHVRDLGGACENVRISSDAVFALAQENVLTQAAAKGALPETKLKIAISVREWAHFKNATPAVGMEKYKEAIRAVTTHLVEKHEAEMTFISTCQGIPEYRFDDSKIAQEIVAGLPDEIRKHVKVDVDFHSPQDLMLLLQKQDVVIATRMHMAILSLAAGTLVLPIAYEFKTQELFERLEMGAWVQDIENIEAHSLIRSWEGFWAASSEIRSVLFRNAARERDQAWQSGAWVKEMFDAQSQASPTTNP